MMCILMDANPTRSSFISNFLSLKAFHRFDSVYITLFSCKSLQDAEKSDGGQAAFLGWLQIAKMLEVCCKDPCNFMVISA